MSERCQVRIGRLVSHPCLQHAERRCSACGRPICSRHLKEGTCVECTGEHTPPEAPIQVSEGEMFAFSESELDAFEPHRDESLHTYDS